MSLELDDHIGLGDWYLAFSCQFLAVLHSLAVRVDGAGEIRCLLELLFVGDNKVVVELGVVCENVV